MFPNCTFRPMNKGNTNFGSGSPDINNLIAVIKYINQNLQKYFVKYPQKSKQTKLGDFYGLWRHLVTSALEFGTQPFSKPPLQQDILRSISQKARKSSISHCHLSKSRSFQRAHQNFIINLDEIFVVWNAIFFLNTLP